MPDDTQQHLSEAHSALDAARALWPAPQHETNAQETIRNMRCQTKMLEALVLAVFGLTQKGPAR